MWNILKGDMSFVGPRLDVPGYADKLVESDLGILKIRSGLTGPARLKYFNEEKILVEKDDSIFYYDILT